MQLKPKGCIIHIMNKIRLDIGGPKGNAWYIMGTVKGLCRQMGLTGDDAADICAIMRGDSFVALNKGSGNTYEDLLRVYIKHFPFVELYSTIDLGLPDDLYTFEEFPEIFEL